ncbi:hypothetical protein D3C80_1044570 [compost metagenome]
MLAEAGIGGQEQAGLVPFRPLPPALALAGGGQVAGVGRLALAALLLDIAEDVLVGVVGGKAKLEAELAVTLVAVFAATLALLVVGRLEVVRQHRVVIVDIGHAALHPPIALVGAEVGIAAISVDVAVVGQLQAAAHFTFEGLGGPSGDQVDRPAQGVGAVQQRGEALGHFNARQVVGGEASQVDIAVVGYVGGNAIDIDRHLQTVEATHVHHLFGTRAHVGEIHPGGQGQGAVDGLAVVQAHVIQLDDAAAGCQGIILRCGNLDFTQAEGFFLLGHGGLGTDRGQGEQQGTGGERRHDAPLLVSLYILLYSV